MKNDWVLFIDQLPPEGENVIIVDIYDRIFTGFRHNDELVISLPYDSQQVEEELDENTLYAWIPTSILPPLTKAEA